MTFVVRIDGDVPNTMYSISEGLDGYGIGFGTQHRAPSLESS